MAVIIAAPWRFKMNLRPTLASLTVEEQLGAGLVKEYSAY